MHFDWRGQLVLRHINPFSSKWRKGGLRVFAAYFASAACTRSSYLIRNWSKLGKVASISILRRIANVQVWILANNGPRVAREGLYLLCFDREANPGFGPTDKVSLAFRLTLGLYQELCRAYLAFSPSVNVCRLLDRPLKRGRRAVRAPVHSYRAPLRFPQCRTAEYPQMDAGG